ncbi:MAG: IS1595 family transposase [Spirochaetia bacterium]|nr:IS1595 family transposase [Spirochaetia bacterium]
MTDKEKEQKALEIYQQLINTLEDVPEKAEIINIVNTLIEENGLSPVGEPKTTLKASRRKSEGESVSKTCPKCGSDHVAKRGSAHGKSRFRCKDCGASFGSSTGRLSEGSYTSEKAWDIFVEGMLCGDSLPSLSEKCGISLSTAHSWRMKLFSQVTNSAEGRILKGVIQEDEIYLPSSFKGNWKGAVNLGIEMDYTDVVPDYRKYGFRDYPHERGSQDRKRGLSRDKVCIATAIDDGRNVIGKPVGRGNVSSDGLEHAFSSRLDQQSILVTDKSKGGIKYAESTGLAHFALDSKTEARKGPYNLQLVNSLHSIISEISHSRFCFATKNAELYITWEAWKLLNRTRSLAEKKDTLKNLVTPGKKAVTMQQIRSRELPEVLRQVSES